MNQTIVDQKYHFISMFNPKTGTYVRTGVINEHGLDSGVDQFMASFPHLIDVGIMGHCIHGKTGLCLKAGIGCYQSGLTVEEQTCDSRISLRLQVSVRAGSTSSLWEDAVTRTSTKISLRSWQSVLKTKSSPTSPPPIMD